MTDQTSVHQPTVEWAASTRLKRLANCKAITPHRSGDELVCANDGFELTGSPLRHDPGEIRTMQALAEPKWPL